MAPSASARRLGPRPPRAVARPSGEGVVVAAGAVRPGATRPGATPRSRARAERPVAAGEGVGAEATVTAATAARRGRSGRAATGERRPGTARRAPGWCAVVAAEVVAVAGCAGAGEADWSAPSRPAAPPRSARLPRYSRRPRAREREAPGAAPLPAVGSGGVAPPTRRRRPRDGAAAPRDGCGRCSPVAADGAERSSGRSGMRRQPYRIRTQPITMDSRSGTGFRPFRRPGEDRRGGARGTTTDRRACRAPRWTMSVPFCVDAAPSGARPLLGSSFPVTVAAQLQGAR